MSTLRKTSIEMENDSYDRSINQQMQVYELYENQYNVFNETSSAEYIVDVDPDTNEPINCTCPHYQYRCQFIGVQCKHMYAVANYLHFL